MNSVLETVTKVIAPATLAFLVLTIVYEWGFFLVVGRQFQTLATTTDYVANAIIWLPYSVLILLMFVDFGPVSGKAANEKPQKYNHLILVVLLLFMIGLLGWVLYEVPTRYALTFAMSVSGFWIALVYYWFRGSDFSMLWYRIVRSVPPLVVAVAALGWQDGHSALSRIQDVYVVQTKQSSAELRVTILRSFDKGLLVRDFIHDKIMYFRWDDILTVSRMTVPMRDRPPLCAWFRWNCPDVVVTP